MNNFAAFIKKKKKKMSLKIKFAQNRKKNI